MTSKIFINQQRTNVNHFNYYYFTNTFTENELSLIQSLGDSNEAYDAVTGKSDKPTEYRTSKVSWIDEDDNSKWLFDKFADLANRANKEMWNFDIWGYQDTFQYTKYYASENGHYDWHVDMGPGMSNRKLSCVLQLSDPTEYEGGDLELNLGHTISIIPKQKNLLCFFPSFILHRVTPVTKGTRISLVTWLCGANLR
jgi:PKHD-type hydroxylase